MPAAYFGYPTGYRAWEKSKTKFLFQFLLRPPGRAPGAAIPWYRFRHTGCLLQRPDEVPWSTRATDGITAHLQKCVDSQ